VIEQETSFRRVAAVLRHPEMAAHFSAGRFPVPPMGPDMLYLKVGGSFMAYHLRGDVAEVHGCLLSADRGPQATEAIREHFRHLFERGVHRIIAVPRNVRAEAKAQAVGMRDTGRMKDGFKVYEVTTPP
jgi:RimJ/RimL family protein N-acetyltransferase